jgi:hypothetical protein
MNTGLIIEVGQLFKQQFGKKPVIIPGVSDPETNDYRVNATQSDSILTERGGSLKEMYRGVEVMLPIRFFSGSVQCCYLPYCVIGVSGSKSIVETGLASRMGSVKELFTTDDYVFNIKGFLIAENRKFPEAEMDELKELYEKQSAFVIDNALTNIFLTGNNRGQEEQRRVVIYRLDFPEVQGGRESARPFTMMLKSDTVFTLELENFA